MNIIEPAARRPRSWATGKLIALIVGSALALTAGCSSSSGTPSSPAPTSATSATGAASASVDTSAVTLHIGDQKGTGAEALLQAAGLLDKLPFKVQWSDFTSGPPMLQAMGSGSIDVGNVGDGPPVFAAAGGANIAIVAGTLPTANFGTILVPKNSAIKTVADLKGHSVAVAEGSSANYQLVAAIEKAGLSVKDITIDNLQPADALSAFSAGHVDAWAVWSPYVEQAEQQYHAKVIANDEGLGGNYQFTVASRSALNDPAKAAAIGKYIEILDKARRWSNTHIDAWAKAWAAGAGLPVSIMKHAAKDSVARIVPINSAVTRFEQNVTDTFAAAGEIPQKIDFSKFVDDRFNYTAN